MSTKFRTELHSSFELLKIETLKLLESTKQKITKEKNFENLPRLENTKVILIHCNIVNSQYQHESKVFFTLS